MATITFFPHQVDAIEAIDKARADGRNNIPVVMATGTGKTTVFSEYARRWIVDNPGKRALIIVHTDELAEQAARRLRLMCPGVSVGVMGGGKSEHGARIVVAYRQTLASERKRNLLRKVGLIIIDECHFAVRTNTYGRIVTHFEMLDDPPLVLGFTATLARGDKQKLSTLWGEPAFTYDILSAIRAGFLLDVTGERVIVPDMDMGNVRTRAGDWSADDIAEELERTYAPEVIANEYVRLAKNRRGIAFWPLVETAYHGARAFTAAGIRSGVVHGALPKPERREMLRRFALPLADPDAIEVMHNAVVLTVGFDEPTADIAVIARPTKSAPLYQQMVGRVLRPPDHSVPPAERKKALVLDVTGAAARHDLCTLIDLSPELAEHDGELDDDHSLLELADDIEEELEAQRAGATYTFESDEYLGPATTRAFDPLSREKVWGTTDGGSHFISVGEHGLVFLAPHVSTASAGADEELWDAVITSNANSDKPFLLVTEYRGLPLDAALDVGETVAAMANGGYGVKVLTSRKAAWRRAEPTTGQKGRATRLGIDWHGLNKGELSDAISIVMASRRIDPIVEYVTSLAASTGSASPVDETSTTQ
jgi:superfamily II DNA or RNA helicase